MEGTTKAMDAVIAAMADVFELSGTVLTQITTNEILLFCFAAGMVGIGISTFRKLKRAAH